MKDSLSIGEARRIALAAQGMARPNRSGSANWTRMARAIDQMKLLQIDSVNVLVRSHYLPVYARVGAYDHAALDRRTFHGRKREFFEYWAHEASFLPLELYPLMRWRMERARKGTGGFKSLASFAAEQRTYVRDVLEHVRSNGPTAVSDLADPGGRSGNWWGWSKGKLALEYLFETGEVTAATRRVFERLYDVPERVIPFEALNGAAWSEADAIRELMRRSAEALGVATYTDLRDYFRLPVKEADRARGELVEAGTLVPVRVEGWKPQAYLLKDAPAPRKVTAATLLSPFDPLVWERSRAERLFDFRYRIEIYTPAPKRVYGYYVLPFLQGDRFTARICLKADRQASVLRANAAHLEEGAPMDETASALATELCLMAAWLGLSGIEVGQKGNLARALWREIGAK